jgi:hypothetical protein
MLIMEKDNLKNQQLRKLLEESKNKVDLSDNFEELGIESLNLIQGGTGSGCVKMCNIDCGWF